MDKQELFQLIPEFSMLNDENLKKRCVDVWLDVLSNSTWMQQNKIEECPFALVALRPECPEKLLSHTRRVTRVCAAVWNELNQDFFENIGPCDREMLIAAALIHDVGKFTEYTIKEGKTQISEEAKMFRHPIAGAYVAEKHGLPPEVVHAVLSHSASFSPNTEKAHKTSISVLLKAVDEMLYDLTRIFWGTTKS